MIRNLKTLGLALMAVFALGAVAASAASAQGVLTSESGKAVTLKGTETGSLLANSLTGPLGSVTCKGSSYTGHEVNSTTNRVPNKSSTATITPKYNQSECKAHIPVLGTRPATVTMNGCDYVFHIGGTTEGTYGVTADVVCPENNVIEVEIYKPETAHVEANLLCRIEVGDEFEKKPVNQKIAGAHLTNQDAAVDDINLTGSFQNIHTTNSGSLCGTGTSQTADLDVDVTITGEDEAGPTGISISD